MKRFMRSVLSAVAIWGLLGVTPRVGQSASLNVTSREVPEAITDKTSTMDTSSHLTPGIGACTTIKRDFTVEAVGNTSGTGAGGTTDRETNSATRPRLDEESRPSGNVADGIGSGTGDSD